MFRVKGGGAYSVAVMWRMALFAESGGRDLKEAGVFDLSNHIDGICRSESPSDNRETERVVGHWTGLTISATVHLIEIVGSAKWK